MQTDSGQVMVMQNKPVAFSGQGHFVIEREDDALHLVHQKFDKNLR